MTFELVGYTDELLEQLGLKSYRKGWWRDLFAPCMASDFKGLKEEYVGKYGWDGRGGEERLESDGHLKVGVGSV